MMARIECLIHVRAVVCNDSFESTTLCNYKQLRVVSCSLTHQSTLTLVHAFVTSRIDSCSSLLAGLPLGTLTRLDWVLLFGSASGVPFCCEGWALGPSGTFSYYAVKGLFDCGPIGLEWSPLELRSLLMTSPSKLYISLKSFFGRDWAGGASE